MRRFATSCADAIQSGSLSFRKVPTFVVKSAEGIDSLRIWQKTRRGFLELSLQTLGVYMPADKGFRFRRQGEIVSVAQNDCLSSKHCATVDDCVGCEPDGFLF
jgi:hypothetical protein